MDNYSIEIAWSDEDGGFIALVPELEGVSAFGSSKEEALAEVEVAKRLYLGSCRDNDIEVRPPKTRSHYSGQLRLRLPKSLHEDLAKAAARDGTSLNTLIVSMLSDKCGYREALAGIAAAYARQAFAAKVEAFGGTTTSQKDSGVRAQIGPESSQEVVTLSAGGPMSP